MFHEQLPPLVYMLNFPPTSVASDLRVLSLFYR